jgi:hypothetical protein
MDETLASSHPLGRPVPASIGDYRITGVLGEGGMGTVYEAEQSMPRRAVALKVVRGGQFVDEQGLRMFQREAETLARLKHPNIASIYESGRTDDGQHFFAMELVRGQMLQHYLGGAVTTRRELIAGSISSVRSARPSSTRTSAASSTGTSSRPTSSSPRSRDVPR